MKYLLTLRLVILFSKKYAQTPSIYSTSTNVFVHPYNFKLYETKNIWTFLKLDTRTGQIWQEQYSMEPDHKLIKSPMSKQKAYPIKSRLFVKYNF